MGFLQNLHSYVLQQCLFLQQCFIESGLGPKGNLNRDNLVSKSVLFSKETLQHMLCCQIQAHIKQAAVFYYKTGPIKAAYNSDTTHNSPINIYLIPGEIHCLEPSAVYMQCIHVHICFFALEYKHLMTFVPSFNSQIFTLQHESCEVTAMLSHLDRRAACHSRCRCEGRSSQLSQSDYIPPRS